jgi:predicted transcriptional regulator
MPQSPRGRGELEREVLAAVAAAPAPVSANDVLRDLGGALAYTTVMTTLARLESKGVLTRQLDGRAYRYALAGDPTEVDASLAAHRMRKVLESRTDRAGVLARFVADLSDEDEQTLLALLSPEAGARAGDGEAGVRAGDGEADRP